MRKEHFSFLSRRRDNNSGSFVRSYSHHSSRREKIFSSIAYQAADQKEGLSGVQPENFSDNEGKLFYYFSDSTRVFWMMNTYFPLDIIYLDQNLKITNIVKDLPAYHGSNTSEIPRAPAVTSRHVLEMKAGSPISQSLEIGDHLEWSSPLPQKEVEQRMKDNL